MRQWYLGAAPALLGSAGGGPLGYLNNDSGLPVRFFRTPPVTRWATFFNHCRLLAQRGSAFRDLIKNEKELDGGTVLPPFSVLLANVQSLGHASTTRRAAAHTDHSVPWYVIGGQGWLDYTDTREVRIPQDPLLLFTAGSQSYLEVLPLPSGIYGSNSTGRDLGYFSHAPVQRCLSHWGLWLQRHLRATLWVIKRLHCGPQLVGNPSHYLNRQSTMTHQWSPGTLYTIP